MRRKFYVRLFVPPGHVILGPFSQLIGPCHQLFGRYRQPNGRDLQPNKAICNKQLPAVGLEIPSLAGFHLAKTSFAPRLSFSSWNRA